METTQDIPNNVELARDATLRRTLEAWLPSYRRWWGEMTPAAFREREVLLRTAVSADGPGWAHYGFVRIPEYRFGLFLAPPEPGRRIGFGDRYGQPVWHEVPSEYQGLLRRLLVTQADTESASVEQQHLLSHTAPSLYDLRNLFQVNVEEGRHVWAMVYLMAAYLGSDGRADADALLARRSGDSVRPRILEAFNQPVQDWLDFFLFTTFTDRVGKFQLSALAESGFDPLSRTCRFMLAEEAHHMFVGDSGIGRVIERSCELMKADDFSDPGSVRERGGIPLPILQRRINLWFSLSLDLFGSEISNNAAAFFASGLKGRFHEAGYADHAALDESYVVEAPHGAGLRELEVPMRAAMNEVQRDRFIDDCLRTVERWNRIILRVLGGRGKEHVLHLPHRRFNRRIGLFSMATGACFSPEGQRIDAGTFSRGAERWLPSVEEGAYVASLMQPSYERGRIAGWLAPPLRGINGHPVDYEYVRG